MKKLNCILILLLLCVLTLSAQSWDQILSDYAIIDIEPYSGGYWLATQSNGALRYDSQTDQWYRYNKSNGIMTQNDNINDMKIMGGKVWFATNYGIYTCSTNGSNWQHKLLPPGDYFSNWVRAFDANNEYVFIAGFTGLYTYSFQSSTFTAHDISLPENYQTSYTNSIFATDSVVWIGTDDGVFRYDTSKPLSDETSRVYYSKSSGINTNSDIVMCRSLYANNEGLFLGLDEYTPATNPSYCLGGLFSFDGTNWTKHDQSTGLPADGIHFIQEYNNKIYAGLFHYIDGVNFNGAGMLVMDLQDMSWQVLDASNWHIGNDAVRSYFCTETDTLVGTDVGLFTNLGSLPDLKPYDMPEWFSLSSLGDGEVEIHIDQVHLADTYELYISQDGLNFSDTLEISATRDTISSLTLDKMYYVMVAGKNEFGSGPKCKDILTVWIGAEKNDILLIQGFDKDEIGNSYDFCGTHGKHIVNAGYGFDAISDEVLTETTIDINDYDMIDWICGVDRDNMSPENKQLIIDYLEAGGNLFISGSQIIDGVTGVNTDAEFYNGYLKASWKKSDTGIYAVNSVVSGIFNGIEDLEFDDGTYTYDVARPDGFKPLDGAESCMLYAAKDSASYGSAALQYTGTFGASVNEAKLIYMGFPLECIISDSLQDAVIRCILDYFEFNVTLTGVKEIDIPNNMTLEQNYPNPFNPQTAIS
ncbi:MAG: hypothetical protein K9N05_01790 [Candidatus Marinimicrobia bacterium]|nr:hypothetical protein [Candidatus Neomarinimicrobiota bacterium]